LFSNEHNNEAQFSSLLPFKQSASPHMNMETAKQTRTNKPTAQRQKLYNLVVIVESLYKTEELDQNEFL